MLDPYRPSLFCPSPGKGVDPSAIHFNFIFFFYNVNHSHIQPQISSFKIFFPWNISNLDIRKLRFLIKFLQLLQYAFVLLLLWFRLLPPHFRLCFMRATTVSPIFRVISEILNTLLFTQQFCAGNLNWLHKDQVPFHWKQFHRLGKWLSG